MTVDIENIFSQSPSRRTGVQISLHHNRTVNNVQTAGESQNSGDFCLSTTRFGYHDSAEFVFHHSGH
jgi:hypothetical protein